MQSMIIKKKMVARIVGGSVYARLEWLRLTVGKGGSGVGSECCNLAVRLFITYWEHRCSGGDV